MQQVRRAVHHRAAMAGFFGVEDAQRVAVQAAPRVVVETVDVALEVGDQRRRCAPRARAARPGC
jgi:hypothetical protein